MSITEAQAKKMAIKLGLDLKKYPLKLWMFGIEVEMEHGSANTRTNVTNDDLLMTAKIALAHILEYPDYYQRLKVMERQAHDYWKRKGKPDLLV